MLSHIKALEWAKENNFPCVAIFEDDVVFKPTFKTDLAFYLSQLPEDWHILYLGGSFGRQPEYFNQYFTKQVKTWGAFAYVVHERAYNLLLSEFIRAKEITDAVLIRYQQQYLCLKPSKKLVEHPPGFSTIKEKDVNYQKLL